MSRLNNDLSIHLPDVRRLLLQSLDRAAVQLRRKQRVILRAGSCLPRVRVRRALRASTAIIYDETYTYSWHNIPVGTILPAGAVLSAFASINATAMFWGTAVLLGAVVPDGYGFISSSGQELVMGPDGITYASALTPIAVPEPTTVMLIALGLGVIALIRRRAISALEYQ
jgi:hypothetical protein